MQLRMDRIGPIFSDRLILDKNLEGIEGLHADHSCWGWLLRIISWICSPCCYSDENRRTIACVKNYLIDQIGSERLNRVCSRYKMSLDKMESKGSPLLTRDLAKIMVGIQDVKIEDIEELIRLANQEEAFWPPSVAIELRDLLRDKLNSESLSSHVFAYAYAELSRTGRFATMAPITEELSGSQPSEYLARQFYDPFLADRERLVLGEENPTDSFETFVHNFIVRIIGREMNIGMLIPAPNHKQKQNDLATERFGEELPAVGLPRPSSRSQFYRVSGKIISGEGLVSYVLTPATADSDLKPIRFFRGTVTRFSAIDAASTMITDMEKDLGLTAFKSGEIYESVLKRELGVIPIGVGHSLGSTILQYSMVKNKDLEEVYLFNGPGLPAEEVDRFNQRMSEDEATPITVHIRDMNTDIFSTVGTHHIGYRSPEKVRKDYRKYYPKSKTLISYAHVQVPDRENRIHGLAGGFTESQIDEQLNRKESSERMCAFSSNEGLRQRIGPCIALIIRFVRNFFRWLCGSRTLDELGIQIGKFNERGTWETKHIRPEDIEPLSEESSESSSVEIPTARILDFSQGS